VDIILQRGCMAVEEVAEHLVARSDSVAPMRDTSTRYGSLHIRNDDLSASRT
jgi:hypothetical protein